jgi:tRNA (mo5U34)-methyltransferase
MDITDDEVRARIAGVPHWYHPIEVRPGIVTPGVNDAPAVLRMLDLPVDCRGMRALDLGARDGYFAFELERRGADVLAVDHVAMTDSGFSVAADLLGSRVTYLQRNLYQLTAADLGTFDIVLFLGLLYHLPDPLGALRIARQLTRRQMYLESVVLDFGGDADALPLMRFFAGASWAGDPTNYWGPNLRCVEDLLGESGFAAPRVVRFGDRALFACDVIDNAAAAYHLDIATGQCTPWGPGPGAHTAPALARTDTEA